MRRSWDPFDPDNTLGLARTKKLLGEFAYQRHRRRRVLGRRRLAGRRTSPAASRTRPASCAACNNAIKADLAAALQEVVDAGLAGRDRRRQHQHLRRLLRPAVQPDRRHQLGSLSRHTWGQALDTNTVANCQGCVPQMDCRVVRIFRKHNFAWGGNFLIPDGMHFEWVGEPRNTYPVPVAVLPQRAERRARIDSPADRRDQRRQPTACACSPTTAGRSPETERR